MTQGESALSRAIMRGLRARGVFCFKIHGGPFMMAGLPDIIACVPIRIGSRQHGVEGTAGIFVGFETKTPQGKDPTPIQRQVHTNIRSANGVVFVVRSVDDAVRAIESLGVVIPPTHA